MRDELFLVEAFLESLSAEKAAAKNTLSSYLLDLQDYHSFLLTKKIQFTSASEQEINQYLLGLEHLAKRSLSRRKSALKSFYNFLLSEKIIKDNPVSEVESIKLNRLLPKSPSDEVVEKLIKYCQENEDPKLIRLYAMLQIIGSSGLRVSELITLKKTSLAKNLSENENIMAIMIAGKGGKERLAMINKDAQAAMVKYLSYLKYFSKGYECEFLFPSFKKNGQITHLTRQHFFGEIKRVAKLLNLDETELSPHKFRHYFATKLLKGGMDLRHLQMLLGHSDISSTQIYTKVVDEMKTKTVMKMHPLARKST